MPDPVFGAVARKYVAKMRLTFAANIVVHVVRAVYEGLA
jgi:hypothetical protein